MHARYFLPFLFVVTASCFGVPAACRVTKGSCKVGDAKFKPELSKRAEAILTAIAHDPKTLSTFGTTSFLGTIPPGQLEAAMAPIGEALSEPRELTNVWDVHGNSFVSCAVRDGVAEGLHIDGKAFRDAAVLFYELARGSESERLSVLLFKERGEYRLQALHLTGTRYHDKTAADFARLAQASAKEGKELNALLLFILAETLTIYPESLTISESVRIKKELAAFTSKERLDRILSTKAIPREHSMLRIAVVPGGSEYRLMPVVSFVTARQGGDDPARDLFTHLDPQMPALREHFKAVAFQAYATEPLDPKAANPFWGTLIPLTTP